MSLGIAATLRTARSCAEAGRSSGVPMDGPNVTLFGRMLLEEVQSSLTERG